MKQIKAKLDALAFARTECMVQMNLYSTSFVEEDFYESYFNLGLPRKCLVNFKNQN
jgi:hypothetical protein